MRRPLRRISLVSSCLVVLCAACALPAAAGGGFGLSVSTFNPSDSLTKEYRDDNAPLFELFGRVDIKGRHDIRIAIGAQTWKRERWIDPDGRGIDESKLTFIPFGVSYQWHAFPHKPVDLYVGAGLRFNIYDLKVTGAGGGYYWFELKQTGFMTSIEPRVGVEFLANTPVRLFIEAKYSQQLLRTSDLSNDTGYYSGVDAIDLDFSGFYATAGISFVFGRH